MKTNTAFLIPLLVATALVASIGMAFGQTEILTFDGLSFIGESGQIPNGYGGLQWNNFAALNTAYVASNYGDDGFVNGVMSPNNVAFNIAGSPALV